MLTRILAFELKFWLRGWMVWIFLFVIAAMLFGAATSDNVRVGGALENTNRNAPFVILNYYSMICIITLLMTTAFINGAATRDSHHRTHEIIFSTPLRKWDYLVGRFSGATLVSLLPPAGVTTGMLAGFAAPWLDASRWGPVYWGAHVAGFLLFAVPNTIFSGAVMFAVASLTRSTVASFLGALLLLVAYEVSGAFTNKLETESIAAMLDPFGIQAFTLMTKYWTVAEKNTLAAEASALLLWNRLLWTSAGLAVFLLTGWRFRTQERSGRRKKFFIETIKAPSKAVALPEVKRSFTSAARWSQFRGLLKTEVRGVIRTTSFLVLLAAALLNTIPSLIFNASEGYGVSTFPVTYQVLSILRGNLYVFLVVIVTYFAGVLVWRERDARCDEIHDALPVPAWLYYAAKLCALAAVIAAIQMVAIASGIGVQLYKDYSRIQLDLYAKELLLADYAAFFYLAVLAFFIHCVSPNKYLGYFGYVSFLLLNFFLWIPLDVETRMVKFASLPNYTLSDFYGYAPFLGGLLWFGLYWGGVSVLLALATVVFWPRGQGQGVRHALHEARLRFRGRLAAGAAFVSVAWLPIAGWVFYNTKVENRLITRDQGEQLQADYEKQYKKYEGLLQPRVAAVKYGIALYPERRAFTIRGEEVLENRGSAPIPQLHFSLQRLYDYEIDLPGARLIHNDTRLLYRIYELASPLPPGARMNLRYKVGYEARGFENDVSLIQVVQNGTFFNVRVVPQLGYQPDSELTDRGDRRKLGLPWRPPMPYLLGRCIAACGNSYLSNHSDLVSVDTVVSTSADQIAIAPGSLLREWNQDGRRYFHYKLDRDSLNFYSFISADYAVARQNWNGVKLEVYYHPEHKWNVDKMLNGMARTLDYCTRNFSPYHHRQARILEFPRHSTFAQAYPGTMPYSEAIGFIANLEDPEDIDHVFYITAHEVAHQWWAYQVIGARMEGATLLSETMAQYTALMVMERQYGRDMMRKFLAYEMDKYLSSRGQEKFNEQPLQKVHSEQGYVHYRKGSVVMYYLKEMIGEEAVNHALARFLARFAHKGPPYPTSNHLLDELRAETPRHLPYLIRDLFEEITLFANRAIEAKARKLASGKYEVTLDLESKKLKADPNGNEREVALNDWIEIGAFAKPAEGKKYGRTLYRQRILMNQNRSRHTFLVDREPDQAGIDPFALLIDRVPKDNLKKVELVQ